MGMIKSTLIFLPLFFLAGCTSYQEQFECEPKKGVGCHSLSEVDQMIEEGKLPLHYVEIMDSQEENKPQKDCSCKGSLKDSQKETEVPSIEHKEVEIFLPPLEVILDPISPKNQDSWEVKRKVEEVIRVWIPPHLDEVGNYHSGSYLYSVLTPGAWEAIK